jgi:hypothetical protein
LLHGQESIAFGDAGYQGIEKRPDAKSDVNWQTAMGPGKRKALDKEKAADALIDQAEKIKAGIRAKVEHPFRVIKRQFGFIKVRFKRAEEKHRATHHAVCVIESVDSSHEVDGSMGMSAPETRAKVKIGFLERMCKITKNLIKRQILLIEVSCSAYS